jgi:hypothetical protein
MAGILRWDSGSVLSSDSISLFATTFVAIDLIKLGFV